MIPAFICGCNKAPTEPTPFTADRPEQAAQLADASAAFKTGIKARMSNDYEVSRLLLSQVEAGMATSGVAELLGPPDSKKSAENETYWSYTLFYSQFIDITFDPEGKVTKVHSSLDYPSNEKGEQSPGAYSSKAADGLTGNAQE